MEEVENIFDLDVSYSDKRTTPFHIIKAMKAGIKYPVFARFAAQLPFNQSEWAMLLGISSRTLQNYEQQGEQASITGRNADFLLALVMVYKRGLEVLGSRQAINDWLCTYSQKFGMKPMYLMESFAGLMMLREHFDL